jgi:hypothetical protein
MTINQWARWVELKQGDFYAMKPLDIQQVPELVDALRQKFFQNEKELSLYKGLLNIACDYLPAQTQGMDFEKRKEWIELNTYKDLFRKRVERIPLKDGDVEMSSQAFRLALIGSEAFGNSGLLCTRIFYSLGVKEKKYILQRQPHLFPFRTQLPVIIGDCPLQEILLESTPQDLLHDAALFGSDTLLEAIKILKDRVQGLVCLDHLETFCNILIYYPEDCKRSLGYQLMMHLIDLRAGQGDEVEGNDHLINSLNIYCSKPDADRDLLSLVYPKQPFKRALLIAQWIKRCPFGVRRLFIPFGEITNILLAKPLAPSPKEFDPNALMREFDVLDSKEKKLFILWIGKIEVYCEQNKNKFKEFLEAVEERGSQPFNAALKLALMARCLTFVDKPSQICLPTLKYEEMIREVDTYTLEDMQWFTDYFLKDKRVLKLFLQDRSVTSFFIILNKLKTSLDSAFSQEMLPFFEKVILEICPANIASDALSQLSRELRLESSLKKYLEEKLKKQGFDQCATEMCTKFFSHEDNGIRFLFSIALLPTLPGKYLIHNPHFIRCVPVNYRGDVEILTALLEPFNKEGRDVLEDKLQTLPVWLKQLLMEDISFTTRFEKRVIDRLNQLYEKGSISSQEMFYFATRVPYHTFLKLANECPYENVSGLNVTFKGRQSSILHHIRDIILSMPRDNYAVEDLRQFLNRCPQKLIGEGKWLQFLAIEAPDILDLRSSKIISQFMPADFVPYVLEFLKPEHRANYLDKRLEPIFSKNIDKFSPQVRDWLIEHVTDWLPLQQNVSQALYDIWEMPRKGLEANVSNFQDTQNLLNTYQQQTVSLQAISEKLKGKNGFERLDSIIKERARMEDKILLLRQKMADIDLAPISDCVTDELLEGEVYSLEGQGKILKSTKDQMKKSPFTRKVYKSDEEKDQLIPPLSYLEKEELARSRQKIAQEIEALRTILLNDFSSDKRPA